MLPLVPRLQSMEEASLVTGNGHFSSPSCLPINITHWSASRQHKPGVCYTWTNLYQHWIFLLGSSKSRSNPWRRTSWDLWVNTVQWPPPERTRETKSSADSPGMIRQGKILKQVQGPSRKSYHKQQKMGLGTKLPIAQVSRFTQDMRLLTGAAQAWSEMLPRTHGQWVQGWGCFGKLGHFSVLRILAAQQSKIMMEIRKGGGRESSTSWESCFRELRFYKQEWSNC